MEILKFVIVADGCCCCRFSFVAFFLFIYLFICFFLFCFIFSQESFQKFHFLSLCKNRCAWQRVCTMLTKMFQVPGTKRNTTRTTIMQKNCRGLCICIVYITSKRDYVCCESLCIRQIQQTSVDIEETPDYLLLLFHLPFNFFLIPLLFFFYYFFTFFNAKLPTEDYSNKSSQKFSWMVQDRQPTGSRALKKFA